MGCASEADDLGTEGSAEVQELQAPSSQTDVPNPSGAYFAKVTANGTGCPAGTWQANISPDGETFTITFSGFETEVDRSKMVQVKDCNLGIDLHTPQGFSFQVSEFFYGGYAYLENGVRGRQQANYYFQGAPDEGSEVITDFEGPMDESFLVQDKHETTNLVWSRCGTDRRLNVRATMRLLNSNPRRNGYMNIAAIDASTKLVFKFKWRRCDQ